MWNESCQMPSHAAFLSFLYPQSSIYKICREMYAESCEGISLTDESPDLIGDRCSLSFFLLYFILLVC